MEVSVDSGLVDIVAERFDAGIRPGEQVASDMIAVRIGPELRMAVVGSSGYFAMRPHPVGPEELTDHRCINLRLQTQGGQSPWELASAGRQMRVRVDGQLVCNSGTQIAEAARLGVGLAFVPEDRVFADVASGCLIRVLQDWCPPVPGRHLYFPSRRPMSAAFSLLVDALRWRL